LQRRKGECKGVRKREKKGDRKGGDEGGKIQKKKGRKKGGKGGGGTLSKRRRENFQKGSIIRSVKGKKKREGRGIKRDEPKRALPEGRYDKRGWVGGNRKT